LILRTTAHVEQHRSPTTFADTFFTLETIGPLVARRLRR